MKFAEIIAIADDSSFIHPEGNKVPAVVHTAVGKTSQAGNVMVSASFRVTGGPNAGKGQPIRSSFVLTSDFARQQLSNLGIRYSDYSQYDALEAAQKIAAAILGKPVAVDIKVEKYNDRDQNKVSWVNPPSGAAPSKPKVEKEKATERAESPANELSELERLRAQVAAAEAAAAREEPRGEHPDVTRGRNEAPDLPF